MISAALCGININKSIYSKDGVDIFGALPTPITGMGKSNCLNNMIYEIYKKKNFSKDSIISLEKEDVLKSKYLERAKVFAHFDVSKIL